MKGLEPPRRKAQDPKSCAATNYATSAFTPYKRERKDTSFIASILIITYNLIQNMVSLNPDTTILRG